MSLNGFQIGQTRPRTRSIKEPGGGSSLTFGEDESPFQSRNSLRQDSQDTQSVLSDPGSIPPESAPDGSSAAAATQTSKSLDALKLKAIARIVAADTEAQLLKTLQELLHVTLSQDDQSGALPQANGVAKGSDEMRSSPGSVDGSVAATETAPTEPSTPASLITPPRSPPVRQQTSAQLNRTRSNRSSIVFA